MNTDVDVQRQQTKRERVCGLRSLQFLNKTRVFLFKVFYSVENVKSSLTQL